MARYDDPEMWGSNPHREALKQMDEAERMANREVWCDKHEDYEASARTDCCDHRYPMCYLTVAPDGTTTCYLCERA